MKEFNITSKEERLHFGLEFHKNDFIQFNKNHAKNTNYLNNEKKIFRSSLDNKTHRDNISLLSEELEDQMEYRQNQILEKNAKW